jgi:hypothetical protein
MKSEIPKEMLEILMVLEAKQVLRGFKSELFPEMTQEEAMKIRRIKKEKVDE